MAESGPGFGARLRARLSGHMQLLTLAVVPVFWLGTRVGMVADVSIWTLLGVLFTAQWTTAIAYALWPGRQSGWRLFLRVGIQQWSILLVMYAIGWGPTLAIGLLVGVADNLRESGSKATLPALVWSVAGIAVGQLAIAAGVAPSLVPEPLVHGLSVLASMGVGFTILLLGWTTAEKEAAEREVRASEERFRALVQHSSDVTMVVDADGDLTYASPAFERVLGYDLAEELGSKAGQLMHDDDREALARSAVASSEFAPHHTGRAELRLRDATGRWRWFDASVTNLLEDPAVHGIVANLRDIDERVADRRALAEANARFRSAFEDAPIGMALADLDGHLFRVNTSMANLLGYEAEDLLGVHVSQITDPQDRDSSGSEMRRLAAGEIDAYRLEKRYVHADGHSIWTSLSVSLVRSSDGEPLYQIGQIEDITERRAISEQLTHAAIHDPLTGLPNRTLLTDRLGLALERARRNGGQIGVIFLDLDRFKFVNDSLGHVTGDELLKILGDRLRTAMRPSDTVARFGGDEFVVLCEGMEGTAAIMDVAERVADVIASPVSVAGQEIFVTASLGVAVSSQGPARAENLLRDADAAMYQAKDLGRARVVLFDEAARIQAVHHVQTGTELHHAVERGELDVYYQPMVALDTGLVTGFEALVRWAHPVGGVVKPSEFIPLAEETGLIVPIGLWVLEEACRQIVCWQRMRNGCKPLSISVNLSARQLAEPTLPDELENILTRTKVDPRTVVLELTESALIGDTESASRSLHALCDRGVQIAVDDFGTGYSSLAHLRRFPIRALKVDQTFVDGLGVEPEDTSIVTAVVSLAHSLGLEAVAEGLETPQQLAALRTIGCDFAQGYLFGRPQPARALGDRPADDLQAWQPADC
jgi:diguanylate cyclase (GGDEF)-like protein/PAS domain S-box-containing protein